MLDSCRAESLCVQVSEIPACHLERFLETDFIPLTYIDDRYIDKRLYRGATSLAIVFCRDGFILPSKFSEPPV